MTLTEQGRYTKSILISKKIGSFKKFHIQQFFLLELVLSQLGFLLRLTSIYP